MGRLFQEGAANILRPLQLSFGDQGFDREERWRQGSQIGALFARQPGFAGLAEGEVQVAKRGPGGDQRGIIIDRALIGAKGAGKIARRFPSTLGAQAARCR